MWRTIIAIFASTVLALAFLAACEADPTDDVPEDQITVDDEDRGTIDEDETPEAEDDDAGAARTDDDDGAQGQTAGELDDEEGVEQVGDIVEVTLIDYEIEMPEFVDSGIVSFGITNDGEETHGISIEPANGSAEDGEIIGTMVVDPGATEQLEIELQEGDYIIFCPIDDHREEHNMETELTVE